MGMFGAILAAVAGLAALGAAAMSGQRLYHTYLRKRGTDNAYALRNVATGLNMRPRNAGIADGTPVVGHRPASWECMTWQVIRLTCGSVLLKNLYTQKTVQPDGGARAGARLCQQPLEANEDQYWELVPADGGAVRVRLRGSELYVTAGDEVDSVLTIEAPSGDDAQLWELVAQRPVI